MRHAVATVAALATLPGFYLYLRGVFAGRIKPHAFSWLVWSALNGIAFSAQLSEGGGAGSYVSLVVGIGTFAVFLCALWRGERNIVHVDWFCLGGAGVAGLLWVLTDDPLASVVLITVIDAFGCYPTFRKAYGKPREEGVVLYALDAGAFLLALAALDAFTVETALFPGFIVVADCALVALILIRRSKTSASAPANS